jgi:hypothetical protein
VCLKALELQRYTNRYFGVFFLGLCLPTAACRAGLFLAAAAAAAEAHTGGALQTPAARRK